MCIYYYLRIIYHILLLRWKQCKILTNFFEIRVCSGNGSAENQEFLMIYVENLRKEFKKTIKEPGLKGSLKSFIKPKKEIVAAVKDISFDVNEGEILGFIGPNGAGKSTVIKMLTGILTPTSGKCTINGKDPQKDRKTYVKEIGVVFGQRTQLWWDLPLTETYTVLKEIYEVDDRRFKKRMSFLNEVLELDSFINSPVRTLSLGQRMRADIAASLLHSPKVLFLDEPTIGLDVVVKDNIRKAIAKINEEEHTTVVLTTHDLEDIELLSKRIVMIDKGSKVLLVIVAIIFASFIYTGIKIGTAAIAFWTKRSGNITFMFYMVNDFVKYPIDIYNNVVRSVLTYIIPFAFTSYFPALYFLTGENPLFNIGMTIVVALIVMTIGVLIWNRGIKAYESAGS